MHKKTGKTNWCSHKQMRFYELVVKTHFEEMIELNPEEWNHFFCGIYLAHANSAVAIVDAMDTNGH